MGKNAASLLFPAVRREILAAMLLHSQKSWYLSSLAKHTKAAPSHLHRELAALSEAGILTRRVSGREVYFEADPACPFLPELSGLLQKLVGAPAVLEKALKPLGKKITCAFIHGSIARGEEVTGSDIDLIVIGDVTISDLLPALQKAERALGRPVNPTVYPPRELARKLAEGHHFVSSVLKDPAKIFVAGSANDLEAITRRKSNSAASDKQGRARRPARRRRSKA
jgi:predicted nucleotidyltransferase